MSMHVPQSIHSVVELINIASLKNRLFLLENQYYNCSSTLLGIYKLTHSHVIKFSTECNNIMTKWINHENRKF